VSGVVAVDKSSANHPSRTWDYTLGIHLIPEAYREEFSAICGAEKFGHLSLRKALYTAWRLQDRVSAHVNDVLEILTHDRKPIDLETSTRNKNRKFLATLPDDVLVKYCEKYNVSYDSFMSRGDRMGLLEAIVDEMII